MGYFYLAMFGIVFIALIVGFGVMIITARSAK